MTEIIAFPGTKPVEVPEDYLKPEPEPEPVKARVLSAELSVHATKDGYMVLHFNDAELRERFGFDGILVSNTGDVLEAIVVMCGADAPEPAT